MKKLCYTCREMTNNQNHTLHTHPFEEKLGNQIGSWRFLFLLLITIFAWILWNNFTPFRFDPYPYIFLNFVLSVFAALTAPIIMLAQNKAAKRDRKIMNSDYHINIIAEKEVSNLHTKLDVIQQNLDKMTNK
jgi:uncharacterized membrane protein